MSLDTAVRYVLMPCLLTFGVVMLIREGRALWRDFRQAIQDTYDRQQRGC